MSNSNEKSLLMIELENEARAKEVLDRDQIFELNKAMYDGKDLNDAAQSIFGSESSSGSGHFRVKTARDTYYSGSNYH